MCQALIDIREEGFFDARVEDILNAKKNFHITLDEAMKGLEIPEKDWDMYRETVEKAEAEQESNS